MSVLGDFKSASIWGKLAFILLTLATICMFISFTCTGWGESNFFYNYIHWGLWRKCTAADFSVAPCAPLDGWANGWWEFTQAAACIGLLGIMIAYLLVILSIFTSKCQKNSEVLTAAAIICLLTGIILLIGCIVFGVRFDDEYYDGRGGANTEFWLSYAFGLAVVAALLEIIAGVFLILDCKGGNSTQASA